MYPTLIPSQTQRLYDAIRKLRPVHYYPLWEGASQTKAIDHGVKKNSLTASYVSSFPGNPLQKRDLGKCVYLGGAGSQITIPADASIDFSTAMSAVLITSIFNHNPYPSLFNKTGGTNGGFEAFADRDFDVIGFKIGNGTTYVSATSGGISKFTAMMVGFQYDKVSLKIYINGVISGTPQAETNNIASALATDLNLGGIAGGYSDGNFDGDLSHAAFFDKALSANEFKALARIGGFA